MEDPQAALRVGEVESSFVGREDDIAALGEIVGGHALVTIVGTAGVGKTRLARELIRRSWEGAVFCDLTEARSLVDFVGCVAASLDLRAPAGEAARDALKHLGAAVAQRGPVVLVLDNFEQLVGTSAGGVSALSRTAPEARIVVTSREPTGVPGEVVFELRALAVSSAGGDPLASEAARLFLERARSVRRDAVSSQEARFVAEIVERLDGLPLAIELAAARMRVLGTRQLAEQLARSFDLLTDPRAGASPKRATLRGAIDWSWDLLRPWERRALSWCAVFKGGFDLDAVEGVLLAAADPVMMGALDVIQALVDRSLVTTFTTASLEGRVRFRLLESIRAYAWEKLVASGELDAAVEAHARHYLALAARLEACPPSRPAAQSSALEGRERVEQLAIEAQNLLAVHARALEGPQLPSRARTALEAALALDPVLSRRGPMQLRMDTLSAAVDAAEATGVEPKLLARGLVARADAALAVGMKEQGRADAERALELARGDPALHGHALASLARQAWHEGRVHEAREKFEEALVSLRAAGDVRAEGQVTLYLGNALHLEGRIREARARYEEALAILRAVGDRTHVCVALGNLAGAASDLGRLDEAWRSGHDALALQRELGDRRSEGNTLMNLGIVALERGDPVTARALMDEAIAIHRASENHHWVGIALGFSGLAHEMSGLGEEAAARYAAALEIHRETRNALFAALVRHSLGRLHARAMRLEEARAALDLGDEELARVAPSPVSVVAAVCRAELALSLSEVALARGEGAEAAAYVASVREALLAAGPSGADGAARSAFEQSSDVRLAHKMLELRLDGHGDGAALGSVAPGAASSPATAAPRALVVAASGRWFRVAGGERVDLRSRRALRLLLKGLADRRCAAPNEALLLAELCAVGWPGEKVHADAGANRVYAALSSLRSLGLRDVLLRRDDGYLFDAAVPLERAEDD